MSKQAQNKLKRISVSVAIIAVAIALSTAAAFRYSGFLSDSRNRIGLFLSGGDMQSKSATPIIVRQMVLASMDDLLPSMNFVVTDYRQGTDSAIQGARSVLIYRMGAPICLLSVEANDVTYPFESVHGHRYPRKKKVDLRFIALHEASHCAYRFKGYPQVSTLQEETFADLSAFLLMYRQEGASPDLLNTMASWMLVRHRSALSADPDSNHDSSQAIARLRDDIVAGRVLPGEDPFAYARYSDLIN